MRNDADSRILSDVVSAHLRSLEPDHLTDVLSSDRHTVKPWFNGRLDVAPPVVDLTAQGFALASMRSAAKWSRQSSIKGAPTSSTSLRRQGLQSGARR
jgi:anti-sigma factor RsiW